MSNTFYHFYTCFNQGKEMSIKKICITEVIDRHDLHKFDSTMRIIVALHAWLIVQEHSGEKQIHIFKSFSNCFVAFLRKNDSPHVS